VNLIPRIIVTAGEPAGIGPDVILQCVMETLPAEIIVIADPDLLQQRAHQLNISLQLQIADLTQTPQINQPFHLKILPVALKQACVPGKLNKANASYVIETLRLAAELALTNKADAIVTGPVHKAIINEAGIKFSGHTEFFAEQARVSQTVMLFVARDLRVALVTTHLPLSQVASAITAEKIKQVVQVLQSDLKKWFGLAQPKIFVAGLNPHAGEEGHLGREEIDIIIPALQELRKQGIDLVGPLPADTLFLPKNLQQADVILAMYHDQALPVVKFHDFVNTVNVTLGLPFIRTSVDHGTALELAGTGKADPSSLDAAIKLAIQMRNIISVK
jgi:4-hydroxythreonine-4-phosphate dehydrogenase